jgi:sialate O-acetylesterase
MQRNIVVLILSVTWLSVHAQVQLAHTFSDHMVLQRDQSIPVWGLARGGDEIFVMLHEQTVHTKADENGRWHAVLKSESAGGPPLRQRVYEPAAA